MKRCEYRAFLELRHNLVGNELAADKLLCTMHYSMTYSLDILESRKYAILLVKEGSKHSLDSHSVVLDRHFLYIFLFSGSLMLDAAYFHTDPLYKSFRKKIINIVSLISRS